MGAVIYLSTSSNKRVLELMREGVVGWLGTPRQRRTPEYVAEFPVWAADNDCFNQGDKFDLGRYLAWLEKHAGHAAACLFATAPDVVGDHAATLERSRPVLPLIRERGYPAAFVAQDGATVDGVPWGEFDVLFIGGTTEFKLGAVARELAHHAADRGMPVHMGRVNSHRRFRYAASLGCMSADGTFLAFGADATLPRLRKWLDETSLFEASA